MKMSIKSLLISGVAAAGLAVAASAAMAAYPEKPVRIIIPFPPGGTTDTVFRTVQPYFQKALGGTVVIVNTKGGGGSVGTIEAIRARPDGYTIGTLQTNTMVAQEVGLGKYTDDEYVPVVSIGDMPLAVTVNGDGKIADLKAYKALAEKNPGEVGVAMGVGTLAHFVAQMMENSLGAKLKLVNAGGGAKKKAAVLGGHVEAMIDPPPGAMGAHKAGQLKMIAVFDTKRLAALPDVPTAREQGVDLLAYQTKGFFVPKGTPADVKKKIADAMCSLNDNTEMQAKLAKLAVVWSCKSGDAYIKYIDGIRQDVKKIAKQMGY